MTTQEMAELFLYLVIAALTVIIVVAFLVPSNEPASTPTPTSVPSRH